MEDLERGGISRRSFLGMAGVSAASVAGAGFLGLPALAFGSLQGDVTSEDPSNPFSCDSVPLHMKADGSFKILVGADIHASGDSLDAGVLKSLEYMLDKEQPDLFILNGDTLYLASSESQVEGLIPSIVKPMEDRGIAWAFTFGNHDDEVAAPSKERQMELYRSYPHCITLPGPGGLNGLGNFVAPLLDADGSPLFVLWFMDSGSYIPKELAQQYMPLSSMYPDDCESRCRWGGVLASQVQWYMDKSKAIQAYCGGKVPGLMFFHIPLQEYYQAWINREALSYTGACRESVCACHLNNGLFAAALERGDIKSMCFGHDHVNDFCAELCGITLSCCSTVSPLCYWDENCAGMRVFELKSDGSFSTRMSYLFEHVWTLQGVNSPDSVTAGEEFEISALVEGISDFGLSFNYAWRTEGSWERWDSTKKSSGAMTAAGSGKFTISEPGVYEVWCDASDGIKTLTSEMKRLVVLNSSGWALVGVDAPASVTLPAAVSFKALLEGKSEGLNYNFAWRYNHGWDEWGSTVKDTGAASSVNQGSFTPKHSGSYELWLDVSDGVNADTSEFVQIQVLPRDDWGLVGVDAPSSAKLGSRVQFTALISGNSKGLSYNLAWSYEGGWSDWDSTLKSSGTTSDSPVGSFVARKKGTYHLWCDVSDGERTLTSDSVRVVVS